MGDRRSPAGSLRNTPGPGRTPTPTARSAGRVLVAALVVTLSTAGAFPGGAVAVQAATDDAVASSSDDPVASSSDDPDDAERRPAPSIGELRDDLDRTDRAIEEARDLLGATREEIAAMTERVRESAETLAAYEAELVALDERMRAAEASARAAAARAVEVRADIAMLDARLRDAEARLLEQQDRFEQRAASAFMYGEATVAGAVVGAHSVHDLVTTTYHLRRVLLADVDAVDEVRGLRAELVEARAEAERLQEELDRELAVAEEARVEAEDLVATQEALAELAEEERVRRATLLRALEVHEAATEAQLVELEEESDALATQLLEVIASGLQWRTEPPRDGSWAWPTSGTAGSPYGYRTHPIYGGVRLHAGVDVAAPWGQPIVAANEGLVVTARCSSGGYGCRVVIDHGGGLATLYAHQSSFAVAEGDIVEAGQVIGFIGSTGASTGPHLHFEVRRNGIPEDPLLHYS